MCDQQILHDIENSKRGDLDTQGLAIGQCMRGINEIKDALENIPNRTEVQQMIGSGLGIHIKTCADARPKPAQPEPVEFHLGKGGLEMKGKAAMFAGSVLGGGVVLFLVKAIPYIREWVALWKGGTP